MGQGVCIFYKPSLQCSIPWARHAFLPHRHLLNRAILPFWHDVCMVNPKDHSLLSFNLSWPPPWTLSIKPCRLRITFDLKQHSLERVNYARQLVWTIIFHLSIYSVKLNKMTMRSKISFYKILWSACNWWTYLSAGIRWGGTDCVMSPKNVCIEGYWKFKFAGFAVSKLFTNIRFGNLIH